MYRLLLMTIALILYGSFYPWHFDFGAPSALLSEWPDALDRFTLRDIVVNVFVYVPLGMFALLAFKDRWRFRTAAAAALMLGVGLSTAVETFQIYIPGRYSSPFDILCNGAGTAAGIGIGWIFAETLGWLVLNVYRSAALHPSQGLLLVYAWIAYNIFPMFPSLSLFAARTKLDVLTNDQGLDVAGTVVAFGEWIAAAKLIEPLLGARRMHFVLPALVLCLPVRLLISQRTFTWDELAGGVGACLVWSCVLTGSPRRTALAGAALLAAVVIAGLAPFDFHTPRQPFSWIPFAGFLGAEWRASLVVLLHKTFWYGALIFLACETGVRAGVATAAIACILAALEICQMYLPGHVAEATDPLYAIVLGAALFGSRSLRRSGGAGQA